MSKRVDAITLNDMLEAAQGIVECTSRTTREAFVSHDTLRYSVSFRLVRLAAAAERVTAEGKRPDIPWEAIITARDRVLHDYAEITAEEVWDRACNVAPKVIEALANR